MSIGVILVVLMLAFGLPGFEEEDSPAEGLAMAENANPDLADAQEDLNNETPSEDFATVSKEVQATDADMSEV